MPSTPSPLPPPVKRTSLYTRILLVAGVGLGLMLLLGHRSWGQRAAPKVAAPRLSVPGEGSFTAGLSASKVLAKSSGELFVSADLVAKPPPSSGERAPIDLALVLDRSGSMAGEKLAAARHAASGIVSRLADRDRVALVQYDQEVEVLVPLTPLGDGGRQRLKGALQSVVEGGSTDLYHGLATGLGQVGRERGTGRVNRVVLLSDGQANSGVTDPMRMGRLATEAAGSGIRVTTVGMGLDYNEDLLALLAESGRGRYYYVRDAASLEQVFAGEAAAVQATVATQVELSIEPGVPGVEILEVYGYDVRRAGTAVVVPMADLSGGESRRITARLKIPTSSPGRMDVVGLRLSSVDALNKQPATRTIRLQAEVTRDEREVEASVNPAVMAHVVQMRAAVAMRQATAAYQRGDQAAAQATLSAELDRAEATARRYKLPAPKVTAATSALPQMAREFSANAPSSEAGKAAIKSGKAAAIVQSKASM